VRKICLLFFVNDNFDCLGLFERAFKEVGFDVESIGLPDVWLPGVTTNYVKRLKALIRERQSHGQFVIFSPQSTELFLEGPDLTVTYSAYRSWFDAGKMRVIPHLWTPVGPPVDAAPLRWTNKPPLRIGFMGRSYTNSRLANILMKAPMPLKRWLLRGEHLRHPWLLALITEMKAFTTFNAFPRIETMRVLKAKAKQHSEVETDFIEKLYFTASEQEMNDYVRHLARCTYIVCPRGTENYSFRIYETLNQGRIPVIIDTDIVLPREIDWDRLAVRVPYESLDSIYDIIVRDYHSRSEADFIARQKRAFATVAELQTMRWITDLASELSGRLRSSLA
jgi:Exostosin family